MAALVMMTACGKAEPTGGGTATPGAVSELPLKRGFYVASDVDCGQASNATLLLVQRGGMSGAQGACEFQAIEQSGPRSYRVTQNCGGLPDEPAEPVHYNIPDDTTFGYGAEGDERSYRYCEQSKLPDPWRDNDISDLLE